MVLIFFVPDVESRDFEKNSSKMVSFQAPKEPFFNFWECSQSPWVLPQFWVIRVPTSKGNKGLRADFRYPAPPPLIKIWMIFDVFEEDNWRVASLSQPILYYEKMKNPLSQVFKIEKFCLQKNRTKNSLVDKKTCNYMHCLIDTGSRNQRNVSKWRHIIWRHYSFLCLLGLITFFHFISGLRPQRNFWSPENILSNGIWYIYIWKKNIFDFFSGCRIMTS